MCSLLFFLLHRLLLLLLLLFLQGKCFLMQGYKLHLLPGNYHLLLLHTLLLLRID